MKNKRLRAQPLKDTYLLRRLGSVNAITIKLTVRTKI